MASLAPQISDPSNTVARWHVVYPNYLDAKKKISEGRRVSTAVAVEAPTLAEIVTALVSLNLHHLPEPTKCYPRDWLVEGRVRVDLDQANTVMNKQQLLLAISRAIRSLREAARPSQAAGASGAPVAGKKKKK
jgi:signal recognition particle subunit SRP19